jgi:hypothetical protein
MRISLTKKVIVLSRKLFLCLLLSGCVDPESPKEVSSVDEGTKKFVPYNPDTWVYMNGKKYSVKVVGDFVYYEEVE